MRLCFEETDKPKPPSKLSLNIKTIPQKELLSKIHKEIRESEQDNVGIEAAHQSEQGAEVVASDNAYTEIENALQHRIDNIENEYRGYDEYRYDLDETGHEPHQLASFLTVTETVEVRYRTETNRT